MSFANSIRMELAHEPCTQRCCAGSELAAALLASGGISFRGKNKYTLTVSAGEAATARRYFMILKQFWEIPTQIRTVHTDVLNGQTRYCVRIPDEDSLRLLDEIGLLDESALFGVRQVPTDDLVRYSCCKKSFVKAAFLMCGAVTNPEKEYHFEIACPTEKFAEYLIKTIKYFEIDARISCRKSKYVVYLKNAEKISEMLSLIGANSGVLQMENVRIKKELQGQVNRRINCDNSNINRTMNAADTQIDAIRYLREEVGLEKLPASLREIAEIRENNPDLSLTALGELMSPPLGKSGVNARMRRIVEMADRLKAGEDTGLK